MRVVSELRRRNVLRMAVLYVVAAWLILQVADVLLPNLGAPDWAFGLVFGLLLLGLLTHHARLQWHLEDE